MLSGVLGCRFSEGTLYNARAQCFERLAPVEAQIKTSLDRSAVVHFDETGLRVKCKLWWLHVTSTAALTYYFVHPKRGQIAIDEMAVLPAFKGTSIHDGWQSYFYTTVVMAFAMPTISVSYASSSNATNKLGRLK